MSKFDLESFIKKIDKANSLGVDEVHSQTRTLIVMRMILDNEKATPDLLNQCTLEELEWVFHLILYWPCYEAGIEEAEDLNHWGIQHSQIRDIVEGLGTKDSVKKRVTFI